jgi:integrase/recombinase XerD
MTSEAMSPLRRRMIEDMTVRKFVEKTQKDYIRYVKDLTGFLGRSPDTATAEDLRRYQLHLTNSGTHPPRINATVSALRFFFSVTLDRAEVSKLLTFVAEPRKIPVVLSPEEVVRFLEAAPGPKYKAALSAAYGAGPARFRGRRAERYRMSRGERGRCRMAPRSRVTAIRAGVSRERDRRRRVAGTDRRRP